ncbi:hypothetical protein [Sphingobacterium corticibacterium]|uniref:Uncharacterized protein n=1 Tax=Sphingobacterium corticibacterium TaxID=2484746 RepID=A0A4Q6XKP4_9SPHI|nr:hypothetical protein [Sphingobacterium corticibacterium]RZF57882.1 hypothetical protein EWE74_19620 [Sphingobacterium corticibacterium]
MKYNINDIKIGDELFFDRKGIDNHDLYWKVVGFHKEMIKIEIAAMGFQENLYIDVTDIKYLNPKIDNL